MNQNPTSKGMAALAAVAPGVLCLVGALTALLAGGGMDLARRLDESGGFGFLALAAVMIAAPLVSVLACMSARGRRVPAVLVIGVAVLPWLIGIAGTHVGLIQVLDAVGYAAPEQRASLVARGVSIAADARALGGAMSGGLLCGLALAYGFGALGQRARGRRGVLALAGLALALPVLGLTGYGLFGAGGAGAAVLIAGLVIATAAALGGAAVGEDEPDQRNRSGSMAVAGAFSGALALAALASSGAVGTAALALNAMESAPPDMRMALLARGASGFGPLHTAWVVGFPAALAPVVLLMIVAAWRSSRWSGNVVRLILAAAVGVAPVVWSAYSESEEDATIESASRPLWQHVPGFTPLAVPSSRSAPIPTPHAYVMSNQIVPWQGAPIPIANPASPLERDRLAPVLQGLAAGPAPVVAAVDPDVRLPQIQPEEVPEWLRKGPEEKPVAVDPAEAVLRAPLLVVAFDARVSGAGLRLVIDAARAAGVRQISLVGIDEYSQPSPEGQALFGGLPYFAHLMTPRLVSADVLVEESLPAGCKGHPQVRSFGTVGAADSVTLSPWPGKQALPGMEQPVQLGPEADGMYGSDGVDGGASLLCLMLGADATPQSAFRSAVRASDRGFQVLLATRAIDVSAPPPPPAPAVGDLAALLAGDGTGSAAVMGSLPRETIQRVVQRHINEIKFCYEKELAQSPQLQGRVTVKFVIAPSGAVQSATVRDSNLGRPEVESCITRAIRRWRFPRPEGGGMVVVSYPFVFTPAGG